MRTAWKKIRYRLEWLGLKSAAKFLPLLSRQACYRLALLLGSLSAMLDRGGSGVASKHLTLEDCRAAKGSTVLQTKQALMSGPHSTCGLCKQIHEWVRGFQGWNLKC